ncbi:DUF1259 domain-containing protein [Streptomyces halobius]|uniref:DUF1259 domain-containing protein n=1 Tax=Streptomyces halobius TaxID=2879846 RepID=A0ABY4M0F1_9ACTN|nr:DUF1259 domain-containing protein [Streptomyces halobius]UQA90693.1 DUF1259 domain-containing protein [Streptomyces halobius]
MISTRTLRLGAVTAAAVLLAGACAADGDGAADNKQDAGGAANASATHKAMEPVPTKPEDWKDVAQALGRKGKLSGGTAYRTGFPRSDLKVTSKGVTVKAGLSLGSYAAFARYGDGTTLAMGDLVVTEQELPKVTDALQKAGIAQTAVHKHLLEHSPQVWWTHFHAQDKDATKIARGLRAALNTTATPPPAAPSGEKPDLDTKAIDQAMGTPGKNDGGIHKFSFARDEKITDHGKALPPAMGVTTAIGFQATGDGKAVINGDFAMTADEVQKVIKALRGGGIDIVELHNHGLNDNPRLFYMHFWAHDDAVDLARTLNKAVAQTSVTPAG